MRNKMIKKTLKNGVRLYLYVDESMKRILVNYGILYGSSGEYSSFYLDGEHKHVLPGCAHFLEHLLLEHSKYGNLYHKFADRKYAKNGLTNMGVTEYYFIGLENIKESIKELISAIQDPVFTNEDIIKSSEAIISGTRIVKDNKFRVARAIVDRNFYDGLELVDETLCFIGDENTTKRIDYEMLQNCYDAFYSDDNKVLLVAGNFDAEEMTCYIESIYDELPKRENRMKPYEYQLGNIRKESQIYYMSVEDDYVNIGIRNNDILGFSEKEIAFYMDYILDSKFCVGSDFIEFLKKKSVVSSDLSRDVYTNSFGTHIYFNVSCKDVKLFVDSVKDELKNGNLSKEYFELYKKKMIANEAFKLDYKYGILRDFIFRISISDDFDDIDFIKSMSFDRCIEFYKTLNFDKITVAIIRKMDNCKTLVLD